MTGCHAHQAGLPAWSFHTRFAGIRGQAPLSAPAVEGFSVLRRFLFETRAGWPPNHWVVNPHTRKGTLVVTSKVSQDLASGIKRCLPFPSRSCEYTLRWRSSRSWLSHFMSCLFMSCLDFVPETYVPISGHSFVVMC